MVKVGYVTSSMTGSLALQTAIAGHSNSMTKKAYATFVLSIPERKKQQKLNCYQMYTIDPRGLIKW